LLGVWVEEILDCFQHVSWHLSGGLENSFKENLSVANFSAYIPIWCPAGNFVAAASLYSNPWLPNDTNWHL
jgi:hypothetical protein